MQARQPDRRIFRRLRQRRFTRVDERDLHIRPRAIRDCLGMHTRVRERRTIMRACNDSNGRGAALRIAR